MAWVKRKVFQRNELNDEILGSHSIWRDESYNWKVKKNSQTFGKMKPIIRPKAKL